MDRALEIIQDYTRITDTLNAICCALENDEVEMPNFVPICNDGDVTGQLEYIIGHLKDRKHG